VNSTNDTGVAAGPASGRMSYARRSAASPSPAPSPRSQRWWPPPSRLRWPRLLASTSRSPETIPLSAIAVVTGFFSVVGIVIAAGVLRWSARPAERMIPNLAKYLRTPAE